MGLSDLPSRLAASANLAWSMSCCRDRTDESGRAAFGLSTRLSRSSALIGRSATSDSAAHTPSVIAKKTASGMKVDRLSVIVDYTLIATIFLIIHAPTSCSPAVISNILLPTGVVNRTLI